MTDDKLFPSDPCLVPGVQPLLSELKQPVSVWVHCPDDPQRGPVEDFVRRVFLRHYGATLSGTYPTLLSFNTGRRLRAAVGVRAAAGGSTFAEYYLPGPAERLIAARWNQPVARSRLAEVGNLALASPGDARWLIAAVTTFLHARGYRWVLFTAIRPLFNAFRRLGLNPVALGPANPARLPDGGRDWGSYYDGGPVVCVGDVQAGYAKLSRSVRDGQPMLRRLLGDAVRASLPCSHCAKTAKAGAR